MMSVLLLWRKILSFTKIEWVIHFFFLPTHVFYIDSLKACCQSAALVHLKQVSVVYFLDRLILSRSGLEVQLRIYWRAQGCLLERFCSCDGNATPQEEPHGWPKGYLASDGNNSSSCHSPAPKTSLAVYISLCPNPPDWVDSSKIYWRMREVCFTVNLSAVFCSAGSVISTCWPSS